jgi:hypothetical protein
MSRNYGRDDGSTVTGIIFAVAIVVSFAAGYKIRDNGIVFGATQTPNTTEIQK